jgi:putative methyltransferase (TIGR04325 family)
LAVVTDIFPNFAAALAACGQGYNDGEIADVVAYMTTVVPIDNLQVAPEQAVNSILAVGMAAAETTGRPLHVLDFGGGCGFHYLRASAAIRAPLRWAIVETPVMAKRAAELAQARYQSRFEAFTDILAAAAALGHVDLVHASSAIQYAPDPQAILKAIAALRPRYFMLARFPSWGRAQIVGVQTSRLAANGYGPMPSHVADRDIKYPITFMNFYEVVQVLNEYEVALATDSPSAEYDLRGQKIPGRNILFRRKAN